MAFDERLFLRLSNTLEFWKNESELNLFYEQCQELSSLLKERFEDSFDGQIPSNEHLKELASRASKQYYMEHSNINEDTETNIPIYLGNTEDDGYTPKIINLPYITPNSLDLTRLVFDSPAMDHTCSGKKLRNINILLSTDVLAFVDYVLSNTSIEKPTERLTSMTGLGKSFAVYMTG